MARIKHDQGLRPSFLDRLIDPDSGGTASRPGYSFQQTLKVIRRDLENLLNTRQTALGPPGLSRSIYAFGLPELTSFNAVTADQKRAIGKVMEQTILVHEPRLQNIVVTLPEDEDEQLSVSFRIEGFLAVEPYDDITFQTVLELTTGRYSVEQT